MLIRAKFARDYNLRYISHLEIMDTFRKGIRRAGLPGAYSQGFNPTLNLSLSQPLPVGMAGGGEFLDLEITKPLTGEGFKARLNSFLPDGLKILDARYIPDQTGLKSLQALLNRAEYHIIARGKLKENSEELIKELMKKDELVVIRKRRNKPDREYDIRPLVFDAKALSDDKISFLVSTGSSGNVRPEEIIKALQKLESEIPDHSVIDFYRSGLFVEMGEKIISPLSDQVLEER
ncbi:MAG: TIGR03936 family radical SAM-associated protein [Bacillota bacterium]